MASTCLGTVNEGAHYSRLNIYIYLLFLYLLGFAKEQYTVLCTMITKT